MSMPPWNAGFSFGLRDAAEAVVAEQADVAGDRPIRLRRVGREASRHKSRRGQLRSPAWFSAWKLLIEGVDTSRHTVSQVPCHCATTGRCGADQVPQRVKVPQRRESSPAAGTLAGRRVPLFPPFGTCASSARRWDDAIDVPCHRPQPRARRAGRTAGHGRGPPRERPAELHAGRPGRHRGQGGARAGARGAAEQRARAFRPTSASP